MKYDEITAMQNETKQKSKIYRAESMALSNQHISNHIEQASQELERSEKVGKIATDDTESLKNQTFIYLQACKDTATFPSMTGLARCCGVYRNAFYNFISRNPKHPSSIWLQRFSDVCLDILQQASLRSDANTIASIFVQKAMYGLREGIEIIEKPAEDPFQQELSAEDIALKYADLIYCEE